VQKTIARGALLEQPYIRDTAKVTTKQDALALFRLLHCVLRFSTKVARSTT
jgi:hypothetical protein